ncbi:MAG: 16S rRNA (adenine(1518)-N(6)/adenine(1519)-N(6))-dimethyltransferase RsmA [Puniceicoccales bacterium]|jgi:16S rRNA (adenine1518-N6/adenine1519-N6)-dimethyltransferase|nr:16S rRNA (adenine(1518)-N(6)/adenine(1519)-N(6))-dimethyltransferase RsmA [Puniceicoccales bacterium]
MDGRKPPLHILGGSPSKTLGQNFLIDVDVIRKSLLLAAVAPGDCVVEIGPGFGILTEQLLDAGADVYAVELDRRLYEYLLENLGQKYSKNFHLLHGDAVTFPRATLGNAQPYKVVANLPYAISTPWLDALLQGPLPQSMTLLLQKETAERIFSLEKSKRRSAISVRMEAAFGCNILYPVAPQCFFPQPKVQSILIHAQIREIPFLFSDMSQIILRHCFNFRRKQLRGVIASIEDAALRMRAMQWFGQLCTNAGERMKMVRAEDLPLRAWKMLDDF